MTAWLVCFMVSFDQKIEKGHEINHEIITKSIHKDLFERPLNVFFVFGTFVTHWSDIQYD